ncbi:MAG: phosphoribosylformylglycinamidine cyclo-ligase [Thermosulfidibacteraceae bacterium]|jgi:phosphoribosylformylglycinamidine cyclo-ligase
MRYKDAGVDIDRAESLVGFIRELANITKREGVISDIGGFAGLFKVMGYKNPVFSVTCDGVGTKLKVAFMCDKHDTVGIDLVAMSANDIITTGADPLVFLDYIACGKLDERVYKDLIRGIVEGCKLSGCYLAGGETAEMPGFYNEGEYDLAGFMVGVCEEEEMIRGEVSEGDLVIALPSSGLHSNGYSLVRKVVFDVKGFDVESYVPELGRTIGEELLEPTKIYVDEIKTLKSRGLTPKAVIHVTGGGLKEKPKRVLKGRFNMILYEDSWEVHPIFKLLMEWGKVELEEMYRTFNMGIGMLLVYDKERVDSAIDALHESGFKALPVGEITEGKGEVIVWGLK